MVAELAGPRSQGDHPELQVDATNQLYLLHGGHAWFEPDPLLNGGAKGFLNHRQGSLYVARYDPSADEWVEAMLANPYPTQDDTDEDGFPDENRISALDGDLAVDVDGNIFVAWIDSHETWEDGNLTQTDDWDLHLRTATIAADNLPRVTKHYYANGQRIATRVDNELYYALNKFKPAIPRMLRLINTCLPTPCQASGKKVAP
ncbi:MAG: hypothetical protein JXM69_08440 [Anaerolineae bacterium]|nr:hypothetical protein [Anaerolineae bacterium]